MVDRRSMCADSEKTDKRTCSDNMSLQCCCADDDGSVRNSLLEATEAGEAEANEAVFEELEELEVFPVFPPFKLIPI